MYKFNLLDHGWMATKIIVDVKKNINGDYTCPNHDVALEKSGYTEYDYTCHKCNAKYRGPLATS